MSEWIRPIVEAIGYNRCVCVSLVPPLVQCPILDSLEDQLMGIRQYVNATKTSEYGSFAILLAR